MEEIDRPDPQEMKVTIHTEWIVGSVESIANENPKQQNSHKKEGGWCLNEEKIQRLADILKCAPWGGPFLQFSFIRLRWNIVTTC